MPCSCASRSSANICVYGVSHCEGALVDDIMIRIVHTCLKPLRSSYVSLVTYVLLVFERACTCKGVLVELYAHMHKSVYAQP